MRSVTAKRLLRQARKNARTGKVAIGTEYDRLKNEHKSHSQNPKLKLSRRQERRKELVVTTAVKDAIKEEVAKRTGIKFKKPVKPQLIKRKPKAYKWRKF